MRNPIVFDDLSEEVRREVIDFSVENDFPIAKFMCLVNLAAAGLGEEEPANG